MRTKLCFCIVISLLTSLTTFQSLSQNDETALRRWKYPIQKSDPEPIKHWQNQLRKHLSQLLALPNDSERPKSFNPQFLSTQTYQGYKIEEIEIQSTPSRKMKLCLGTPLPQSDKPQPAVVCIHGHGGNRWSPFQNEPTPYHQFGIKLLQHGFVVISTDVGQHEIYESGRTLMGERLWDLIRCIDYLEQLTYVDIGCAGLSLGGEMAMWLSALDTRIQAGVICGFLTYMDQMEKNHCMCWKFPGLREAVDFPDIYALIAPRALQCQNGEKEPPDQFPPSLAQKAWDEITPAYKTFNALDKCELIIHPGGHEIAIEPMLQFLKKHLLYEGK